MNQSSTVELILRVAKAVNPMRQVQKEAKKTEAAIRKNKNAFEALSASAEKIQKSIEKSQGSFATGSRIQATFSARVLNTEKAMRAQIRALRQVQSTVKFNGALYQKAGAEIARYEAILRSANSTAEKAKTANGGLAAGLRNLAIGFGAARAAQATLQAGIRRDESERRLRLLTQRFGETAQAQEAAQRAADKFNLSQTEANVQLSRLIARLRPMGLSMATIETAFAGFNTATILAGATASESAGAFLQLSQALGSGVLRGQELNSILEQAPLIAQAIALEMGVTVGALKKLGEEGEITSEIVIAALGRVERDGADQLTEALKGPAASIKDFQNAAEDVQVALTQDIIPEMARSFRELAGIIEDLGPLFRFVGAGVGGALSLAREGISALTFEELRDPKGFAEKRIREGKMPSPFAARALFEGTGPEGRGLAGMQDLAKLVGEVGGRDRDEVLMELMQKRLGMFAAPGRKKTDDPKTRRDTRTDGSKVDISQRLVDLNKQLFAAEEAGLERRAATLKLMVEQQKIAESKLLPLQKENKLNEAMHEFKMSILKIDKKIADQTAKDIEKRAKDFEDQLHHQEQLRFSLENQNRIFADIGQTIQDGLVRGIEDAITGAKSLREALSGVFKSIGGTLLRSAINSAVSGINFGGGGGTPEVLTSGINFFGAEGGYASGATNAVIGEAGPEYLIPENKMRESMARYSRGVRGSAVIPENGEGGTNSMGGGTAVAAPIDVRYTVERINSVDYVTADQFQRGMQQAAADGAKQGEQRALTTLRQNTSQRRRIGL